MVDWLTMKLAATVFLGLTALLAAIGYMQGVRISLSGPTDASRLAQGAVLTGAVEQPLS